MISTANLRRSTDQRLRQASKAATQIGLAANAKYSAKEKVAEEVEVLSEMEYLAKLEIGYGRKAWAAILFVDLRNSSRRAKECSDYDTYLTMHAYLHAVGRVAVAFGGYIVGFRGDGLFAAFGIDRQGANKADLDHGGEVNNAVKCGKAMVEAVDTVVAPALQQYNVDGNLIIGVGIDAIPDEIVITRVGVFSADEITVYGHSVNTASKLANKRNGGVLITKGAWDMMPSSEGGKWTIGPPVDDDGGHVIQFPSEYREMNS